MTADPRPVETLEGVLADHAWPGEVLHVFGEAWFVCKCGEKVDVPVHSGSIKSREVAALWNAHVAAEVRAWLLSDERVEAAIGGISDLRDSRFQVGEYVTVDGVARAALSAALGGGDDGE